MSNASELTVEARRNSRVSNVCYKQKTKTLRLAESKLKLSETVIFIEYYLNCNTLCKIANINGL